MTGEELLVVGKPLRRVDALDKVTGQGIYTGDLKFPDMLHAKVKRSEHAHARILRIETSEAESLPGVIRIFTSKDVPGENNVGVIVPDQPVFAEDTVRHYGDAVAMVVAESEDLVRKAVDLIKVDYDVMPGVFDPEEAMLPNSPLVHPDGKYGNEGNVLSKMGYEKGDVEKGFRDADIIVEEEYRPGYQEHAFIETERCIATSDGRNVTVYGSLQCPFYVRDAVAGALGIPRARIRIIQTAIGGAFGGKEDVPSELCARAALAAYILRRPVRKIRSREDSIVMHTKRHPMIIRHRLGATREGELVAARVEIISDQGAYCSVGKYVQKRAMVHACGAYDIPNSKVDTSFVYTNNILTGAFRGFGGPQVAVASELQMDELARRLGMDPLKLRLKNIVEKGGITAKGQNLDNCGKGLRECIEKAANVSQWDEKRDAYEKFNEKMKHSSTGTLNIRKGIGMSSIMYGVALGGPTPDSATSTCQITEDGSVIITTGGTEMGQGAKTVLSQIAAEAVGVPLHYVTILDADTSIVQNSGPSVASRITPVIGEATRRGAKEAVSEISNLACKLLGVNRVRSVIAPDGTPFSVPADAMVKKADIDKFPDKVDYHELVRSCYGEAKLLLGVGFCSTPTLLENGEYRDYYTYSFACHIAEVEVDMDTGRVMVKKLTCANDVGKAINPQTVEGQIEGGAVQGMGYGLMEELVTLNGRILNPSLVDYHIPTSLDAPQITPLIIEEHDSFGPYGAKGIGEPSLIPTPAAVLNAVGHAIGLAVRKTPASPENVWRAIRDHR
ncbi:MAG: xanthine dehydrogenase family protein molybdopterin-binding subunit [Candidatus Thermoplasmatota archaeon]|jgi:CO/xanthine dehydrogenase Mo-binding subunit|nr:xanthine dehydrogenase family protein molybdopterin-binding subunit [Candidatus Thermoplasmatota archaeon]MDP7266294.1 xanthine dehydrogenase family protein molybdopterin-binding subunit [Candidatus Thermoplasmatota archaeon]